MRILMLGAAAIALSGCSFLGLGGNKDYSNNYNPQTGYYGQPTQAKVQNKSCHSGNCLSRWNLEGGIGPSFSAGKNIITASGTNDVDGFDFESQSFGDAYDTGVRAELGGSYALAPNTKVTLLGHYEHADGGDINTFGTFNGTAPIRGSLSDYKAFGAEIGLRQYFQPTNGYIVKSIRPYVEGRLGASRVDDIQLRNATFNGNVINDGTVNFYDNSWVPTAAGLVGVETPVAKYTTIGLETGLRYQGGLESDNDQLAPGTPFRGLNDNSGRLSIPVTIRGRYRF